MMMTAIAAMCALSLTLVPTLSATRKIPIANFGESGIIRCRRCRAYINPFITFTESGRKWQCNLCDYVNDGRASAACVLAQQQPSH